VEISQLFLVLLDLLEQLLVALVVALKPGIDVLELSVAAGRRSELIYVFHLDPPL